MAGERGIAYTDIHGTEAGGRKERRKSPSHLIFETQGLAAATYLQSMPSAGEAAAFQRVLAKSLWQLPRPFC